MGDPYVLMKFHKYATVFWIAAIPLSIFTGWINSVAYVSALSLWALVGAHWGAWQAARVEVKEDNRDAFIIHYLPCRHHDYWPEENYARPVDGQLELPLEWGL